MRALVSAFVLALVFIAAVGCGGSSEPTTVDADELEQFLDDNADAAAQQESLDGAREDSEDD